MGTLTWAPSRLSLIRTARDIRSEAGFESRALRLTCTKVPGRFRKVR